MKFIYHKPLTTLKKRWKLVLLGTIVFGVIGFGLSFLFPLEYRADAQVLIISKSRFGVDPYTAVKSAERVGENIVALVDTDDFYNKVREQREAVASMDKFDNINEQTRRRRWKKTVRASVVYGTGFLNINTYDEDKQNAEVLAEAVAATLSRSAWEYVGGDVSIRVVNRPVVSIWPVRPNIPLNTIFGFIVGFVLSSFVVVRRYR